MNSAKTLAAVIAVAALALLASGQASQLAGDSATVSPDEALKRLLEGNARFVSGTPHLWSHDAILKRRSELVKEQKPFAIVVGCSDSRVGPEVVFDEGLGDLFVIRTAGEVVDPICLGSIEYGVEHLGASLIVVLGHQRCGAVSAAVSGGKEEGHIPEVLKAIEPAIAECKGMSGDPVDNAVRANALYVAKQLEGAPPILAERVHSHQLKVVSARYDLDTGKVEVLSSPNDQH
jgi:carbonic anhydrase